MGLFDFFKSKKDVFTDNGKNYIYYDNGKLKEEFTFFKNNNSYK